MRAKLFWLIRDGMDATDMIEATDGGALLRVWIAERNLKQYEVAEALDTTPNNVSLLCNGHKKPGLALAVRIEKVTGIPVEVWT